MTRFVCLILFLGCLPASLFAQQTVREGTPVSYWLDATVYHVMKDSSQLSLNLNLRETFAERPSPGALDRGHVMLEYMHSFDRHWKAGVSGRLVWEPDWLVGYTRAYLEHRGQLLGVDIWKQLGYEWVSHWPMEEVSGSRSNYGRISAMAMMGKDFRAWDEQFRAELSGWLFIHHRQEESRPTDRRIDHSRFRQALHWQVTESVSTGLYVQWDTQYYFALGSVSPVYDEEGQIVKDEFGNDVLQEIPDRNVNRWTPVVGLNVAFRW